MIKPHKACDIDLSRFKGPAWLFHKLDGVRALHVNAAFTGRSLKPHANKNLTDYFGDQSLAGLDGELTIGSLTDGATCRRTTSGVTTIEGPRAEDFVWHIFDDLSHPKEPYWKRYGMARERVSYLNSIGFTNIHITPYTEVMEADQIVEFHLKAIELGYEGTVVRNPYSPHKNGRATITDGAYLRLKDFADAEAVVLEIVEGDKNHNEAMQNELGYTARSSHKANKVPNGMVGALICRDVLTQAIIKVAAGAMTHNERKHFFDNPHELIGRIITYKSMVYGVKDKPRFGTFKNIRALSDIS